MKKLTIIIAVFLVSICNAQKTPIYLNFRSHNEVGDPLKYDTLKKDFDTALVYLNRIVSAIHTKGAAYNMQVESNFINASIKWKGLGTNILKVYDDLPSIEVDLHNHFDNNILSGRYNPYNYADMNYLITNYCGLSSRNNIGGFFWEFSDTWDFFLSAQPPNYFTKPNKVYTNMFTYEMSGIAPSYAPAALTGGGSKNDQNNLEVYGVWMPTPSNGCSTCGRNGIPDSPNKFLTNRGFNIITSDLRFIGDGCHIMMDDTTNAIQIVQQVREVINRVNSITSTSSSPYVKYTQSIMFNFRDIQRLNLDKRIDSVVTMLQRNVDNGEIIWATYTQKMQQSVNYFSRQLYFQDSCSGLPPSLSSSIDLNLKNKFLNNKNFSIHIYPNPASSEINVENKNNKTIKYKLVDALGATKQIGILNGVVNKINITSNTKGFYILQLFDTNSMLLQNFKIIIQ